MHAKLQNFVFGKAGADISHHFIQNLRNLGRILFNLLYHEIDDDSLTARTFRIVAAAVTDPRIGGCKCTADMTYFAVIIPKVLIIRNSFILYALCFRYLSVVVVCTMAVATEQEMKAKAQEARAKVIEAEAEVPKAMAEAFRNGNLGIMDYYRMKNIEADTSMRENIAKPTTGNTSQPLSK